MTDSALVIEGITAGYGGGDVLHDVSFSVPEGGITCIVGPNGAGKSTLLAVISGMLRPRAGQVLHRGERLTGKRPREILPAAWCRCRRITACSRDMTVKENVELGGFTLGSRALVASRRATVEALFPDIGVRARKKAGSLSGGQQRLVEFARCLMLDPAVGHPGRAVDGARAEDPAASCSAQSQEMNARAGRCCSSSRTPEPGCA